jgi:hypothetical protein
MKRIIVSEKELISWITSEFKKSDNCKSLAINGIKRLNEPDETGCNWVDDVFINFGDSPKEICSNLASEILHNAYLKFNLA